MGRPSTTKPSKDSYRDQEPERSDGASMTSAMSLHSNIGLEEQEQDDDEELPPYSDDPEAALLPPSSSAPYDRPPLMRDTRIEEYPTHDQKGTQLTRVSPVLTTDPIALKAYLLEQSKQELQAHIAILGSHQETHRTGKDKTEKKTVHDFNFYIDVTNTINKTHLSGVDRSTLKIVDNEQKTYRGGRVKSRDDRFRADLESTHSGPSLDEWCHLFCASSSKCKTFTLRRIITNRDEKALRDGIEAVIRRTRYRGRLDITFPTHTRSVTVMSPHWLNKARNNVYIWWACVLLQLWIITWPILWLVTRRWDVVRVEFPHKRLDKRTQREEYVLCSENAWVAKFDYTIAQAATTRVGYGTNIVRVDYVDRDTAREAEARLARQTSERLPQGGLLGGAIGLVRSGLALSREYREGQDWGYDD